ncbi:MAG: hypothetical protein RR293_04265 [Bacteroidales bacterium]
METNNQLIYNGDKFREFLSKNKITYQNASNTLGIDKNTIGKAVRGGNVNTSILLKICNTYKLNLSDFFSIIFNDTNNNHNAETRKYSFHPEDTPSSFAGEPTGNYSTAPKSLELLEELVRSKDVEINQLKMLLKLYEERANILQSKILKKE